MQDNSLNKRSVRARQTTQRFVPGPSDKELRAQDAAHTSPSEREKRLQNRANLAEAGGSRDENLQPVGSSSKSPAAADDAALGKDLPSRDRWPQQGTSSSADGPARGHVSFAQGGLPAMYQLLADDTELAERGSPESSAAAVHLLPKTPHFASIAAAFVGATNGPPPTPAAPKLDGAEEAEAADSDGESIEVPRGHVAGHKRIRDATASVISQLEAQFPSASGRRASSARGRHGGASSDAPA